jgi:hypothetical protein
LGVSVPSLPDPQANSKSDVTIRQVLRTTRFAFTTNVCASGAGDFVSILRITVLASFLLTAQIEGWTVATFLLIKILNFKLAGV